MSEPSDPLQVSQKANFLVLFELFVGSMFVVLIVHVIETLQNVTCTVLISLLLL